MMMFHIILCTSRRLKLCKCVPFRYISVICQLALHTVFSLSRFRMPSEEDIIKGHRFRSKESIKQRLGDMNHQFNAIAAMAQNIESDLKTSKMVGFIMCTVVDSYQIIIIC